MPTYNTSDDNFGVTSYIVDGTAGQGNFTTIGAALTAASTAGFQGTIFIRPGTYTENLTLLAGVNLCAWITDQANGTVTIVGKLSFSSAGTVNISGIQLKTNLDYFLSITGSVASIVNLYNCNLNAFNNQGINYASSSSSAQLNLYYCNGTNNAGTGNAFITSSTPAGPTFLYCDIENSSNSTTASTFSAGGPVIRYSRILFPITTSSTAGIQSENSVHFTDNINVTAITHGGSGTNCILRNCTISSSTASAVSVGTGSVLEISNCQISSSNSNSITGAGTVKPANISFSSSNSNINTTTNTPNYTSCLRSTLQPCFEAQRSSNVSNVTGDATTYTILFNSSIFDQLSNYNTGTGTFTAPYTGRYLFSIGMQLSGLTASHTTILAVLNTTARTFTIGDLSAAARDNNNNMIINGSVICSMTAGDTATVTIQASNGTKVVGLTGGATNSNTYFSGSMLC